MAMHVSLVARRDLKGEIYRRLRAAIRTGQTARESISRSVDS